MSKRQKTDPLHNINPARRDIICQRYTQNRELNLVFATAFASSIQASGIALLRGSRFEGAGGVWPAPS